MLHNPSCLVCGSFKTACFDRNTLYKVALWEFSGFLEVILPLYLQPHAHSHSLSPSKGDIIKFVGFYLLIFYILSILI